MNTILSDCLILFFKGPITNIMIFVESTLHILRGKKSKFESLNVMNWVVGVFSFLFALIGIWFIYVFKINIDRLCMEPNILPLLILWFICGGIVSTLYLTTLLVCGLNFNDIVLSSAIHNGIMTLGIIPSAVFIYVTLRYVQISITY